MNVDIVKTGPYACFRASKNAPNVSGWSIGARLGSEQPIQRVLVGCASATVPWINVSVCASWEERQMANFGPTMRASSRPPWPGTWLESLTGPKASRWAHGPSWTVLPKPFPVVRSWNTCPSERAPGFCASNSTGKPRSLRSQNHRLKTACKPFQRASRREQPLPSESLPQVRPRTARISAPPLQPLRWPVSLIDSPPRFA